MNRLVVRLRSLFLLGLVTAVLSHFAPSAMLRAQSPCTSGTGNLTLPCTIGGSVTLSGVTKENGGAFSGTGGGCNGGKGSVTHTITNDPVNPAITLGGGAANCTITGPWVKSSIGTTVLTFSALSGYAIQRVTASSVCGVTAGGFMSETITAQTSAGQQTLTAGCPTEPSGETGTATGQISFAPVASVDFGLTFSSNIPSGGVGTLNSLSWGVSVVPTNASPTFAGSMAQLASGGGWDTTLTLVNTGTSSGDVVLNFYGPTGSPWVLPVAFPQVSASQQDTTTLDRSLNANALLLVDSQAPGNITANVGSAQLLTEGDIGGFAIFTYLPTGQAAVVPLETRNASAYLLAFDNTSGLSTGVALANIVTTTANIPVVICDDTGAQIGTDTITLGGRSHTSFTLNANYPVTQGKRGTIEFETPTSGQISALGIRGNGNALTTIPVLANVTAGAGSMAQVASGGGWQTTFTLVNTGTSPAQVQLSFLDGNGNALSLPLNFAQTGTATSASSINQSIAAGASLVIVTQGGNAGAALVGSAQLTSNGSVGGYAIFRYNPTGQEAVVPLETRNAGAYMLAFDNTNGLATGLALANLSNEAANVPVTIRDDTGATLGTAMINLAALGHTSFVLTSSYAYTADKRGTVEFDTPAGAQISALGLRATPAGAVTTIPVLVK